MVYKTRPFLFVPLEEHFIVSDGRLEAVWIPSCVCWRWLHTVLIWIRRSCQLVSIAASGTTFLSRFRSTSCRPSAKPHRRNVYSCIRHSLIQSQHKSQQQWQFFFFCVQERVRVSLFNDIWRHWLSVDGGLWCHDAEDHRPTLLLLDSTAGPRLLLFPTGASESYRKDLKPLHPGCGMCFDHALVILGLYEVQRALMWSDWWTQRRARPAEERPDGWQELESTFHLHMMQAWGTCYTVWELRCKALPQRAKQMWTVHYYIFIGSTSSRYICFSFCLLEDALRIPLNLL